MRSVTTLADAVLRYQQEQKRLISTVINDIEKRLEKGVDAGKSLQIEPPPGLAAASKKAVTDAYEAAGWTFKHSTNGLATFWLIAKSP